MNPNSTHETLLTLFSQGLICVPGEECDVDLTEDPDEDNIVRSIN